MPKKSRKQKSKQKPKPVVAGEPVFIYTSVCHSVRATKTPVTMPQGRAIGGFGSSPDPEGQVQGLGHFRCTQCNKPCKVTRMRNDKAKKSEGTSESQ